MIPLQDIGAFIHGVVGRIPETITAAAGNDNVEIDGPSFDRLTLESLYLSCTIWFIWSATQDTAETLTLTANMQDSPDDAVWADLGSATSSADGGSEILAATVVDTGAAATAEGTTKFQVEIQKADQWLRLQSTADMSRGATDTTDIAAILILGGGSVLPAVG